jgi:hypothetical protein
MNKQTSKPDSKKYNFEKDQYDLDRSKLIEDFIAHQDCDPFSYVGYTVQSEILLQDIADAGSISNWLSLQSETPEIFVGNNGIYEGDECTYEYCQCPHCI